MNRTTAIILTIVSVLLCGCPGLAACIVGVLAVAGVPFTTTVNGYSSSQPLGIGWGVGLLCLAIILIIIPIVVGVLTLRKKKEAVPATPPSDVLPPAGGDPLPPAS